MGYAKVAFRVHALRRMFERQISEAAVIQVLDTGETIEHYSDDTPYPSRLVLGWSEARPIHVVVADDVAAELRIVITVYQPDPWEWEPGFRRRKKR
jgi:hypothetical protein